MGAAEDTKQQPETLTPEEIAELRDRITHLEMLSKPYAWTVFDIYEVVMMLEKCTPTERLVLLYCINALFCRGRLVNEEEIARSCAFPITTTTAALRWLVRNKLLREYDGNPPVYGPVRGFGLIKPSSSESSRYAVFAATIRRLTNALEDEAENWASVAEIPAGPAGEDQPDLGRAARGGFGAGYRKALADVAAGTVYAAPSTTNDGEAGQLADDCSEEGAV